MFNLILIAHDIQICYEFLHLSGSKVWFDWARNGLTQRIITSCLTMPLPCDILWPKLWLEKTWAIMELHTY